MKTLKEKLNAKLSKNGGFTLVEMLIVVAIIAILIAVSIPLVASALEKARDATDQANERAAKAEATLVYMGAVAHPYTTTYTSGTETGDMYYNATTGKMVQKYADACTNGKGYGQCTGKDDCYIPYGKTAKEDHSSSEMVIKASVAADGTLTLEWTAS